MKRKNWGSQTFLDLHHNSSKVCIQNYTHSKNLSLSFIWHMHMLLSMFPRMLEAKFYLKSDHRFGMSSLGGDCPLRGAIRSLQAWLSSGTIAHSFQVCLLALLDQCRMYHMCFLFQSANIRLNPPNISNNS